MNLWKHSTKFKTQTFKGAYERDKKGERIFTLTSTKGTTKSTRRRITFESWQMAKKMGWNKL